MPSFLPALVKWIEKQMAHHSRFEDSPFIPESAFPWSRELEDNWRDIRAELDTLLEHRDALPNFQDISTVQRQITNDNQWKTFFFYGYGYRFDPNCERCPRTAELLAHIPGLKTAFFSILGPRKHVPPHRGPYKGVVRYHLGLKIPSPEDSCGIRVGGQEAHWREGAGMFFDDTYEHEAWNGTDEDRAVLFLDVVRPMAFPYSLLNDMVIKGIARSRFVQDAKGNQDAWEQRFAQLLPRK
ncbi:aspartyl/asparaginyl beta-hydroxylase domain-containing protein [Streptomyces sp. N2A]|uniref:aspartyl/asparaginyl beta-hydroxylase domain-containing protein n=1 Tax=Streptomyces sp. N2A TaxID=3073936 RepID=UPI002870919F|nr:aspartyl/asparaginyl beta-hydroxylase domain-containing protein [Streptomyces sp. N2A]